MENKPSFLDSGSPAVLWFYMLQQEQRLQVKDKFFVKSPMGKEELAAVSLFIIWFVAR